MAEQQCCRGPRCGNCPGDSTEQALGLYAEQAEAIRELLDKHAPHTTGNLQARIAVVLGVPASDESQQEPAPGRDPVLVRYAGGGRYEPTDGVKGTVASRAPDIRGLDEQDVPGLGWKTPELTEEQWREEARIAGVLAFPRPAGYVTDLRDGATFMLTDENDIGIAVYTRPQLEQARTADVDLPAVPQGHKAVPLKALHKLREVAAPEWTDEMAPSVVIRLRQLIAELLATPGVEGRRP